MSKRALKKYLAELEKEELEIQVLDLYERFSSVREFYNFVFNPKEDRLVQEAKMKISNEYFPLKRKRPKARRSVAQKYIRNFHTLGMDPVRLADLMIYNIEIAQSFEEQRNVPSAFYKSMLNSFSEALRHVSFHGILPEFKSRIISIYRNTQERNWPLAEGYAKALDIID